MSQLKKVLISSASIVCLLAAFEAGDTLRHFAEKRPLAFTKEYRLNTLLASSNAEVPEGSYFTEMTRLLKREYVDPIKDERKLAIGAVRGMVSSLAEPHSLFMDSKEFGAYLNAKQGKYEGIGVDFALTMEPTSAKNKMQLSMGATADIPRLTVIAVAPHGPADRAGVKVGDWVDTVDNHWVINTRLVRKFRDAQQKFEAKKISDDEMSKWRRTIRQKTTRSILPLKAKDLLFLGKSGEVNVVWVRGDQEIPTRINKATSQMPSFEASGAHVTSLPFTADSAKRLGKLARTSQLTIDLRNNVHGDYASMRDCLAVLAPRGTYGNLANSRGVTTKSIQIAKGNARPPKLKLIVDNSTRGVAEIFALALTNKKLATMSGKTSGDPTVVESVQLPDGSGYTLLTGKYAAGGKK